MRSIRLGPRRFGRGGEPREGREVNGTVAQVVPKGTIRSVMAKHRREGNFRDTVPHDDTAAAEVTHRRAEERKVARVPGLPADWSVERGRQHLRDVLSGRPPQD